MGSNETVYRAMRCSTQKISTQEKLLGVGERKSMNGGKSEVFRICSDGRRD